MKSATMRNESDDTVHFVLPPDPNVKSSDEALKGIAVSPP